MCHLETAMNLLYLTDAGYYEVDVRCQLS